MKRGNPNIGTAGAKASAAKQERAEGMIEAAKARIKERILADGKFGEGRLTMKAFLREAGLNLNYFEGEVKKPAKQEIWKWLELAARNFKEPEAPQPQPQPQPPPRAEDSLTTLRGEFVKLQNAYVAAHLEHVDRADELAEANERIDRLEGENARLWRLVQGAGLKDVVTA